LVERLDDLCAIASQETGKPRFDVVGEVFQACQIITYYARHGAKLLRPRRARAFPLVGCRAQVHYRPLGIVGIVTPSNYPIVLVVSPIVQALVAGNAVILKPSERTSRTAARLWELFDSLGPPHPVWQVVEGGPGAAVALASGGVDKLAFTGGATGGRAVARAAAERLTPVVLELGGNDPMLVADDADLDRAARAAVWGAFMNAGQSCIAIERCYVARRVHTAFVARLVHHTNNLTLAAETSSRSGHSPSDDGDYDVGTLQTDQQLEKVKALVADAIANGAHVAVGGIPQGTGGRMFPPTVLTNVGRDMRIMQEEIFGPVLAVMEVENLSEAVRLANESRFGLGACIWSADVRGARRWAAKLHTGGVVINDCLIQFAIPDLPFGGVKESGCGRLGGREGVREFCAIQTITVNHLARFGGIQWFPYGRKHRWLAAALRLAFGTGLRSRLGQLKLLLSALIHK
jgi:acyl-CoA reductase-like NAD-dependent aldehyde dehydrogenase